MDCKRWLALMLIAALVLCGCSASSDHSVSTIEEIITTKSRTEEELTPAGSPASETSASADDTESTDTEADRAETESGDDAHTEAASSDDHTQTGTDEDVPEAFSYQPHQYVERIAQEIPQDHWESLYHLCDALRAGEDTFACSTQEAYEWCMDPGVLANLIPAASMRISGQSDDGTAPFKDGTGRIFYRMPAEEFAAREAAFEEMVAGILNSVLEADDDDYEKCLKLYDYMETNYVYEYEGRQDGATADGYIYYTLVNHIGQCIDLAGVYSFLLRQAGVEAFSVGCYDELDHEWTYAVVNGVGYHIDPTWALKSDRGSEELYLGYFMMDDNARTETGCPVDDLTVQLLPQFWVSRSTVSITAPDRQFYTGEGTIFTSLEEKSKTLVYQDRDGLEYRMNYGKSGE